MSTEDQIDDEATEPEPELSSADGAGAAPDDAGSAGIEGEAPSRADDDGNVVEAPADSSPTDGEGPLEVALAERDEYLDALRRLQAEFDNYRKRVERQQAELRDRAGQSVLERLLPVLDAIDLAIAHHGGEGEGDEIRQALGQIASLTSDVLTREGLERIDTAEVDFDPTVHDAVAHEPASGADADDAEGHRVVVDTVLRAGYRLKGRVLRPAMVKVRG